MENISYLFSNFAYSIAQIRTERTEIHHFCSLKICNLIVKHKLLTLKLYYHGYKF